MSYIYTALKPHLCKNVIGIIEDMVKWEGDIQSILNDKNSYCYGGKITIKDYKPDIPIIKYDANFGGEKLFAFEPGNWFTPRYAVKNQIIPFEYFLKRVERIVKSRSIVFDHPCETVFKFHIDIIKINESCYILSNTNISYMNSFLIVNSLDILYDKYFNDEEKKDFLKLGDLKE